MGIAELASAMKPFLDTADDESGAETITRLQVTQMIEDRIGVSLHK